MSSFLEIDLTPLWDTVEAVFGPIMGPLLVVTGLMVAIYLSQYLVTAIIDAFRR